MRSATVACTALAAIGMTLGGVALLSAPDRLLGAGYDHAIAAKGASPSPALVAAATGPGSEHFWLTRKGGEQVKPASVEHVAAPEASFTTADIRQALAAAGETATGRLEVISVKEVGRISLGGTSQLGKAALVTVRIGGNERDPGRLVSFVVDAASGSAAARAL